MGNRRGRPVSGPMAGPAHSEAARRMCVDAVAVARLAMDREAKLAGENARLRAFNAALLVKLAGSGGLPASAEGLVSATL